MTARKFLIKHVLRLVLLIVTGLTSRTFGFLLFLPLLFLSFLFFVVTLTAAI